MDYANATQTLRRLALQFQGIVDAADYIEKMGSLDTAAKEAQAARDKALAERDRALDAQKQADLDLEAAHAEAARVVADAKTEAETLIAEARDGAKLIVADAQESADQIRASANIAANEAHAQQLVRAQLLEDEITGLAARVSALRGETADAEAQAKTAADKLAQIQAAISKIAGSVN